jgi:hypothetical protein
MPRKEGTTRTFPLAARIIIIVLTLLTTILATITVINGQPIASEVMIDKDEKGGRENNDKGYETEETE